MTIQGEDGTVRYSVKELFARIDAKLDGIAIVLDAKADHTALVEVERRVTHLESIEDQRTGSSGTVKAILGVLLAIGALLIPVAVHYIP